MGLSVIQGARIGGARRIIGIDRFDSKLEMATALGATETINSSDDDPVALIRSLTGGEGVDHAFEAVGVASLVRQAVESLAIGGPPPSWECCPPGR